jgi:hypothetical protein
MDGYPKKYSISTIIITIMAIIIILFLAFLFYYYSVTPLPSSFEKFASVPQSNNVDASKKDILKIVPTDIITFVPPDTLPTIQKSGNCFSSSIAEPYRKDAWRCMVANNIYDPCFETKQKGLVFCPINPLSTNSVLIKLTKALPKLSPITNTQDNWAWFLVLEDGTYCSPFMGTRPIIDKGQVAYYACNSSDKNKQVLLIDDLIKGVVWKANESILTKFGNAWSISSKQQVNIKTVWQ